MASLPYPLNLLYTHIVSVIATTQSACILMSVWVWQGCHTLLQIPILLSLQKQHVLMFFCLFKNNLFSCPLVFPQQHVLMFFCLFKNNLFSCSSVFSTTTCSHVLMSSKQQHVLLSFPQKEPCSPSNPVFMSPKKNG